MGTILFSYPDLPTIVGIQGALIYAACTALPPMVFVILGPKVQHKLTEVFLMTTWVRHQYGEFAGEYISFVMKIMHICKHKLTKVA